MTSNTSSRILITWVVLATVGLAVWIHAINLSRPSPPDHRAPSAATALAESLRE